MPVIHPTAIVESGAEIADDVSIGPYCQVGANVKLGAGVRLESCVIIDGQVEVGAGTEIMPFAVLGKEAQDIKSRGRPGRLVIGANNVIREHCTMHGGTEGGGGVTRVGDNGYFMVNCHVAHDCQIGNGVVMCNNTVMGGHVILGEEVILGGNCAIHQFVRIGRGAMIGGQSGSENDVIPYGLVSGNRDGLTGLNLVGLRRRGYSRQEINDLRRAYRLLFNGTGAMSERAARTAEAFPDCAPVQEIIDFINTKSTRPVLVPRQRRAA